MISFPLPLDHGTKLLAKAVLRVYGGRGSGNFGHAGRPGQVGGSATELPSITALRNNPKVRVTENPIETKFLLPDGTRLAIVGEHRTHESVAGGERRLKQLLDHGVIRANPYEFGRGFEISGPVTDEQFDVIESDFWQSGGSIDVWKEDKANFRLRTREFEPETKASVIRVWVNAQLRGLGGAGSGNFGHSGRPGQVGGSGKGVATIAPGIFDAIQQADGGFTYHVLTGQSPTTGFVVSLHKDRERVIPVKEATVDTLAQYAVDNWDLLNQPNNFLGGWHNPENGKVYLDVSTVVNSADEAFRLGAGANQEAYFDLAKGQSVPIAKRAAYEETRIVNRQSNAGRVGRLVETTAWTRSDTRGVRAREEDSRDTYVTLGGPGSGNFGHVGRPGQVGGSATVSSEGLYIGPHEVFHGTQSEALESIKKHGLSPFKGVGTGADEYARQQGADMGGRPASVYFTHSLTNAGKYAKFAAEVNEDAEPIILKIEIPRDWWKEHVRIEDDGEAFAVKTHIPPEWITGVGSPSKENYWKIDWRSLSDSRVMYAVVLVQKQARTLGGVGSGNFGHQGGEGGPGNPGGSSKKATKGSASFDPFDEVNLYDQSSKLSTEIDNTQTLYDEIESQSFRANRIRDLTNRIVEKTKLPEDKVRREVAARLALWADTSGDHNENAVRMQHSVAQEFDVEGSSFEHLMKIDYDPTSEAAVMDRHFLRAEYENTQATLKRLSVKKVTVYRGMLSGLPPGSGELTTRTQPASSWTLNQSTATNFANSASDRSKAGVIATQIPASEILSTGITGRGSTSESEVILLGGVYRVKLRPWGS